MKNDLAIPAGSYPWILGKALDAVAQLPLMTWLAVVGIKVWQSRRSPV